MSYTFSRRDFMKYTALAAAAVAVSGSLTGCSNPNQPSGKVGDTLSFGGSSGGFLGFGATHDQHTLKAEGTSYDGTTLTCAFTHSPVSQGTSCTENNYQILIVSDAGAQYCVTGKNGVKIVASNPSTSIKLDSDLLPVANTLTITGLDLTGATAVYVQYFPRHNALGNETDTYSDVYATWDVTSVVKGA